MTNDSDEDDEKDGLSEEPVDEKEDDEDGLSDLPYWVKEVTREERRFNYLTCTEEFFPELGWVTTEKNEFLMEDGIAEVCSDSSDSNEDPDFCPWVPSYLTSSD